MTSVFESRAPWSGTNAHLFYDQEQDCKYLLIQKKHIKEMQVPTYPRKKKQKK